MKHLRLIIAGIILLSWTAVHAQVQDLAETADTFIPDFSSDPDMKPVKGAPNIFTLTYGGWITSIYIDDKKKSDENGEMDLSSSITTAKIWLRTTLPANMGLYVRGKDTYLKIINDKGYEDIDKTDNQLVLDAAYLSWSTDKNMLNLNIGRKLYNIGTGIVLCDTGDGGDLGFYSKYLNIELLGMYTGFLDKDANPYGLSDKDYNDGAKRVFAGGTISESIYNQKIYLLGLYQMDKGDDASDTKKTTYNSLYYGAGLEGIFWNAQYYAEYIIESGKSYMTSDPDTGESTEKKDIKASAGNFGLNYYFNIILKPAIVLGYSFASGDKDRISATSPNGSTKGDDEGFIYFGKFVGGFALRPKLSNIHIYRAGLSINPVSFLENNQLNRMSLIFKWSRYNKDDKDGAISDTSAVVPGESYIGDAYDVSFRWKIFYDFSIFANYGLFKPGDAYPSDEENRTFIMAGVNLMI